MSNRRKANDMAKILSIDPGPTQSAWLCYDTETKKPGKMGISENRYALTMCKGWLESYNDIVVIEMVASYGMPVGKSVFDTVLWIGAFWQATDRTAYLIYRRDVKLHLCNSVRAKDANVRQAIIDRYEPTGGGKIPQVGTKDKPGPLYGIKKDLWSALAIAITYAEKGDQK